jgi:LPXTG cell wall anchor motif
MKRQIFMIAMALVLIMGAALMAQSTSGNTQLPPSQQVDQSGKPETGTGPDVDVDVGKNAEDGVMDVDVKRHTDADTAAQGNDPNRLNQGTTTGTTGTTGTYTGSTTADTMDNDTGMAGDQDNLPATASDTPLLGLMGLLALAGALVIRSVR